MSQHDFEIANQGFPATRADLNNALQALASLSAGSTEPSTTYAYQLWYDEANDLLKMRNSDDDAFITLAAFDQTNDEWEVRSAVIQAVDSAGVVIKDDAGTAVLTVSDGGGVDVNGTITSDGADLDGAVVINESGANVDFRVEGDTEANLLFVDASADSVGIGTSSPESPLNVYHATENNIATLHSGDTNCFISFRDNTTTGDGYVFVGAEGDDLKLGAGSGTQGKIDSSGNLQFNSGYGSVATAYGCRAWVCFNGTGTVAILADGNVSSITDNAAGDYTVNFSTAMTDQFYAATLTARFPAGQYHMTGESGNNAFRSTTQLRVEFGRHDNASTTDSSRYSVAIFR